MTVAKAMEYEITRQLLQRRERARGPEGTRRVTERFITGAAAIAAVAVLGSVLQELLWVVVAGAVVLTLGTSSG